MVFDARCRQLIAEHYPWFLDTYDALPKDIMRADAVRCPDPAPAPDLVNRCRWRQNARPCLISFRPPHPTSARRDAKKVSYRRGLRLRHFYETVTQEEGIINVRGTLIIP